MTQVAALERERLTRAACSQTNAIGGASRFIDRDLDYGAPSEALKAAWRHQGWRDGDPILDVVYKALGD